MLLSSYVTAVSKGKATLAVQTAV